MYQRENSFTQQKDSVLSINSVLRNTYLLLSLTLLFSGAMAYLAMVTGAQPVGPILFLVGAFGLMFLTQALSHSSWGLLSAFAFTGFMGYTLGPILNIYMQAYANGAELIATSLFATGVTFLGLSAYVLISKKDFSYMGGFLTVMGITLMIGIFLSLFMPAISIFMSMGFVLFASAMIMFQTSMIINGGERNYIMATINLYVSIYNLFISLLRILSSFSGRNN